MYSYSLPGMWYLKYRVLSRLKVVLGLSVVWRVVNWFLIKVYLISSRAIETWQERNKKRRAAESCK